MKVYEFRSGRLRIGAVVSEKDGQDRCPLLDGLANLDAVQEAHKQRLLALIELAAHEGLDALSVEQCHLIDRNEKIYEFRTGRLRVPFFKLESGKVVLCTHVFLKKTQKTSKTDVLKAVRWKKTYENAGEVEWME